MKTENTPAPETETPAASAWIELPAPVLRAALKACAPAMSKDENRFVLNGVLLELSRVPAAGKVAAANSAPADYVLTVVGCDGRRLHVAQIPTERAAGFPLSLPFSFILSAVAVKAALKACFPAKLKNGTSRLDFFRRASGLVNSTPCPWIRLSTSAGEHAAQEVSGNYPNFRQVIPAPVPAALSMSLHDVRNGLDMIEEESARVTSAAVSACFTSAQAVASPLPLEQIKAQVLPQIKKQIKRAREKWNTIGFEKIHGGRLLPLKTSLSANFKGHFDNAGNVILMTDNKGELSAAHGSTSAPAGAHVAFNPAYLSDLLDSVEAYNSAPGAILSGALSIPDTGKDSPAPAVLRSAHALDSGQAAFVAVIMAQRIC